MKAVGVIRNPYAPVGGDPVEVDENDPTIKHYLDTGVLASVPDESATEVSGTVEEKGEDAPPEEDHR